MARRSAARRWLWVVAVVALTLPVISGAVTSTRVADADEPAAGPRVDLGDNSGLERDAVNGSVFVPVTLSEPAAEPVVVSYHTADGSAVAGTDYLAWGSPSQPRTVTIPAGRLQTTINVPVLSAGTAVADTQFEVVATAVSGGGAVLGDATGVATIVDSDALSGPVPVISVSQPTISEGRSGQRLMQFQIHLSRATSSPLALTYATADESAQAGVDYVAKLPGTVVFAPGQISKTIDVLVNSDEVPGADRSFVLDVAVVGGPPVEEVVTSAVATIRDDDVAPAPVPIEVSGGAEHSCALLDDGSVRCWGLNSSGQLGNGTTLRSSVPVTTTGPAAVAQVVAGANHTCAVTGAGVVWCWGANPSGQVGDGSTANRLSPVAVALPGPAVAVAPGGSHTCALLTDGSVHCWGANSSGQLGNGSTVGSPTPVAVTGVVGATSISSGTSHSCALLTDQTVRCWGAGASGRLGNGATANATTPVAVSGLTSASSISVGGEHSCAALTGGTVRCWGAGASGRLGNGATANATTPVAVSSLTDAIAVSAGGTHTCAIRSGGSATCWGDNLASQLGAGTSVASSTTPVSVVAASGVTQLDAGGSHVCVVASSPSVSCWGSNSSGQIGNGLDGRPSSVPVATSTSGPVTQVSAGGDLFGHACAAAASGTASCWGYGGQYGQLGNGSLADALVPTPVTGLTGVVQVGAGGDRSCALLADGTVRCWGMVLYDEFLDLTGRSNVPVTVPGLSQVTQLSVGLLHACALRADGTVWCWGNTFNGRLGTTFSQSYQPVPAQVPGLSGVQQVAAGNAHSCALLGDGTARCWGSNASGQLGNGSTGASTATPQTVVGLTGLTQLSPLCAVGAGGAVSCWGTGSGTAAAVPGLNGVVEVASQSSHSCGVLGDGTARCWGSNASGQLGDGTTTASATPVVVSGLSGATDIAVGQSLSCAVVTAGAVRCWGDNSRGQLGNGGRQAPTPVPVVGFD